MEAMLLAALIYVATKIGEELTGKISKSAADGLFGLGTAIRDQITKDPEGNKALAALKEDPSRSAPRRIIKERIIHIRDHDEDFDRRISSLERRMDAAPDINEAVAAAIAAANAYVPPQPICEPTPQPSGGYGVHWEAAAAGGVAAALKAASEELPYTTVHAIITQIGEVGSRIADIMDGSSREGEVLNPGHLAAEKVQELLAVIRAWEQAMADYAASI